MSTNMGSNWLWTDEDIIEFHKKYMGSEAHDIYEYLKKFKQSKTKTRNNQDWEILEIESHGGERRKLINGLYRIYDDGIGFDLDYLLKRNDTKIISVKVLSSGEIFSVGDFTNNGKIIGFQLGIDNRIMLAETYSEGLIGLDKIEHKKQRIFTTEDGVDKFEGDRAVYVDTKGWYVSSWSQMPNPLKISLGNDEYKTDFSHYKWFDKEDAANTYLVLNKPGNLNEREISFLRKLLKQKINQ